MGVLSATLIEESAARVAATPRGIIICGPAETFDHASAVSELASATGYPILADPLSTLRFGPHDLSHVISSYDTFLREPEVASCLAPDLVIRFGAMPTSKPLQQFLTTHPGQAHLLIDPGPPRDPFHLATTHLPAAANAAAHGVTAALKQVRTVPDLSWRDRWLTADRATHEVLAAALAKSDEIFEGYVAAEIVKHLPDGATLVVGNSMPVRDLDTFAAASPRDIRVVGTRGASGIDGVVSTAMGASSVSQGPVVLFIGDLSLYHDMNGLLAAKRHNLNLILVVVNNNGGGIFSFLPQQTLLDANTFEQLFGTPLDLDFARVAALYDASFARPPLMSEFAASLCEALSRPGLSLLEVQTDRQENVRRHREITAEALEAVCRAMVEIPAHA